MVDIDSGNGQSVVLVPIPEEEVESLVQYLREIMGLQSSGVSSIDELFEAIGYEPVDVGDLNLDQYDKWRKQIGSLENYGGGQKDRPKDTRRLLTFIALALIDLAETHKKALPPVV